MFKDARPSIIYLSAVALCLSLIFSSFSSEAEGVPNVPSDVYIDSLTNQLIVTPPDGTPHPYIIKGVNWSPATMAPHQGPNPIGPNMVDYGFFFDWPGRNPQGHELMNYWLKNELINHYLTDIPLLKAMNVNTVRLYSALGSSVEDYNAAIPQITAVLDEFYRNHIMVIMVVASAKNDFDSGKFLAVVNAFKNHPAVLMWAIGNEWNINKFYYYELGWDINTAIAAVNNAVTLIKNIDSHHPVSSVLGDIFAEPIPNPGQYWTIPDIVANCPDVDVWGLNVYRGNSFGGLFNQWRSISSKPIYISEFGIDSFNTTSFTPFIDPTDIEQITKAKNVSGSQDETTQANVDTKLWKQIKANYPLAVGGLVFEFNDSLWKGGNYNVKLGGIINYNGNTSYDDYNGEGFVTGAAPDNVFNEEHFGVVKEARTPKAAYAKLQEQWRIITSPLVAAGQVGNAFSYTATTASWLLADTDNNKVVDAHDLGVLAVAWQAHEGDLNYDTRADFNLDGLVDIRDLYTLAINWQKIEVVNLTASPLPPGLNLAGEVISGTPTQAGTFNVTLTATNDYGSDIKTLVITINPQPSFHSSARPASRIPIRAAVRQPFRP